MIKPFTKILDRYYFIEFARQELNGVHQYHYSLSLLIINLSNLHQLEYNHFVQDEIIKSIGQTARETLRRDDYFAYLNRAEFVALLPSANISAAIAVAQRLCYIISELSFIVHKNLIKPTVNIGIASYQDSDGSIEVILERANQALLTAKSQGSNCFTVHPLDLENWLMEQQQIG